MEKFINPAPYGNMKSSVMSKSVDLISYPNSKIVNPYNGVVVFDRTPSCENSIKIKHEYNGEHIYSEFCNVGKTFVSSGDRLKQGDTIGYFTDDRISYSIKTDDDKKQDVSKYMNGFESKKEESKKEDPKKEEPKNLEPKIDTTDRSPKNRNIFLDLLLSPIGIANDVVSDVGRDIKKSFKEDYSSDKRLTEQIDKIKKIIKN
jgi:hypothetical protein